MNATEPFSKKSRRLLLVEDNENYAFTLTHALETCCHVDHCMTETEALRKLYIETYDVMLLDLTLETGYLSGFRFLDYLKRLPRFQNLVIIGLSGMSLDDVHSNSSFDKLTAFLTKPVTANDLIETIERCMANPKGTVTSEERKYRSH